MPDIETIRTWQGRILLDRNGGRIGSIDAIYLDDRTGQPEWALVNTGLFGTKSSFVPLAQAFQSDHDVLVPYDKHLVKHAPRVDVDQRLSEAEERQLWQHYGLDYDIVDPSVATDGDAIRPTKVGRRGRVRLRRYVTTEHVEQVVPVRRERVRLDKDTVTGEERVAEEVRTARIEVDEDTRGGRHQRRRRG
jgi:PRC-barrel domain/Domain of unknown function (DUF2382)